VLGLVFLTTFKPGGSGSTRNRCKYSNKSNASFRGLLYLVVLATALGSLVLVCLLLLACLLGSDANLASICAGCAHDHSKDLQNTATTVAYSSSVSALLIV
jgi:hypothetical protein